MKKALLLMGIVFSQTEGRTIGLVRHDPKRLDITYVGHLTQTKPDQLMLVTCPGPISSISFPCAGHAGQPLPLAEFEKDIRRYFGLDKSSPDQESALKTIRRLFRQRIFIGQLDTAIKDQGDGMLQEMVGQLTTPEESDEETRKKHVDFIEGIVRTLKTPDSPGITGFHDIFFHALEPEAYEALIYPFRSRYRDSRGPGQETPSEYQPREK